MVTWVLVWLLFFILWQVCLLIKLLSEFSWLPCLSSRHHVAPKESWCSFTLYPPCFSSRLPMAFSCRVLPLWCQLHCTLLLIQVICFQEDKGNALVENTDFHRSRPACHHQIITQVHAAILSGQDLFTCCMPIFSSSSCRCPCCLRCCSLSSMRRQHLFLLMPVPSCLLLTEKLFGFVVHRNRCVWEAEIWEPRSSLKSLRPLENSDVKRKQSYLGVLL